MLFAIMLSLPMTGPLLAVYVKRTGSPALCVPEPDPIVMSCVLMLYPDIYPCGCGGVRCTDWRSWVRCSGPNVRLILFCCAFVPGDIHGVCDCDRPGAVMVLAGSRSLCAPFSWVFGPFVIGVSRSKSTVVVSVRYLCVSENVVSVMWVCECCSGNVCTGPCGLCLLSLAFRCAMWRVRTCIGLTMCATCFTSCGLMGSSTPVCFLSYREVGVFCRLCVQSAFVEIFHFSCVNLLFPVVVFGGRKENPLWVLCCFEFRTFKFRTFVFLECPFVLCSLFLCCSCSVHIVFLFG